MNKKATKGQQKNLDLEKQLEDLKNQLISANEDKIRVLADYQNLVRRTKEEKNKLMKLFNKDLIVSLLQPLQHLEMAAKQISDSGLEMVVGQFKQNLSEFGLEEIETMGKEFDLETMEVVEMAGDDRPSEDEKSKVIKVSQKGYILNGEVIQHTKVVLG